MNNLSLTGTEIPIFFHILKGHDMHHIIKELEERKVEVIGTSKEIFITAKVPLLKEDDDGGEEIDGKKPFDTSKLNYKLKDSFMNSSLTTLASNLEKEDLISIFDFVKKYFIGKCTQHINVSQTNHEMTSKYEYGYNDSGLREE